MKLIDLITIIGLISGLFLVMVTLVLLKRKNLKAKALPYVFGVGGWIYAFISMMTASMLLRPISEFVNYAIENLFWSLALGIVGYIGGRGIARNMPD
jgi:cation transporter-like permease